MIKKYFEYIVLGLLLVVIIQSYFITSGVSEEEVNYLLKIKDLEQEKELLLKENDELESKIINFKDEIIKNDTIIDNYTKLQLDSFFTDYLK